MNPQFADRKFAVYNKSEHAASLVYAAINPISADITRKEDYWMNEMDNPTVDITQLTRQIKYTTPANTVFELPIQIAYKSNHHQYTSKTLANVSV